MLLSHHGKQNVSLVQASILFLYCARKYTKCGQDKLWDVDCYSLRYTLLNTIMLLSVDWRLHIECIINNEMCELVY
jgi:hypothetical protein